MTPDEIKRLRELLGKATPGEWEHNAIEADDARAVWVGQEHFICGANGHGPGYGYEPEGQQDANMRFIAAAKNSMEALLDAAEERERLANAAENVLAYAAAALYALETRPETKAGLHRALDALAHALKETSQ